MKIMLRILLPSLTSIYPLHAQSACRQSSLSHILNASNQHLLGQQMMAFWTRNYSIRNFGNAMQLEEEHLGTLSEHYSSRTVFNKSSPDLQHLQYFEDRDRKGIKSIQKIHRRKRNTPYWYFLQFKAKIKESKLAEALELFEVKMLLEEHLQPEEYHYTVLIGACGRVGYVKKAFQLYSNMKKRGLKPTDATYTALFNACAESPWKDSGFQHAFKLQNELKDKNIELNPITYRSLLKSYTLCSGLQTGMGLIQNIPQKCLINSPETFNILLMGCIKDENSGFRYALKVWKQMTRFGIKPNIETYNLLLCATRNCGIGNLNEDLNIPLHRENLKTLGISGRKDKEHGREIVEKQDWKIAFLPYQVPQCSVLKSDQSTVLDVSSEEEFANIKHLSQDIALPSNIASILPNPLDLQINTDLVSKVENANTPFDRFALIGGLEGILQRMKEDHVSPTVKTFTLIADVMKPDTHSEATILNLISALKIKPDLLFLNTLMLKGSEKISLKSAKKMLMVFTQLGIAPNIHTFCNLAKACHKKEDGLQLLQDMAVSGIHPNNYVYSALINAAIKRLDYSYITDILRDMKNRNVPPNTVVISQLEFAAQYPPKFTKCQKKKVFLDKIDGFRGYYNRWLEWMEAQETEHQKEILDL